MSKEKKEERVLPIKITDNQTGAVYELDFNREAISFAEKRKFIPSEVTDFPEEKFPEIFYYSFRMNHKNMSRAQTDNLYSRLGGFSVEFLERLLKLYNQAAMANIVEETEDMGKNGNMTVEL